MFWVEIETPAWGGAGTRDHQEVRGSSLRLLKSTLPGKSRISQPWAGSRWSGLAAGSVTTVHLFPSLRGRKLQS